MEPRIQYAKTSDGVNIAFWTLGEGVPILHLALGAFGHSQREWQMPAIRAWYQGLASRRRLVRLDSRGQGLSDRDVADLSAPAWLRDVEAVAGRLSLDRYVLFGLMHSGPIAIAYAAFYPDKISHLILWCTFSRGSEAVSPELRGLGKLRDANWDLYAEAIAHSLLGWSEGDKAHEFASVVKESITQETLRRFMRATLDADITPLLERIRVPTLVLHRRGVPLPDVSVARNLASRIPNAHLVLLEGTSVAPWLGDTEAVLAAIDDFLDLGARPARTAPSGPARSATGPSLTAVILFADIADSTGLTERLGDSAFRDKARDLDTALRTIIRDHTGTPIEGKLLGDGVLATFTSARLAIEAALACGRAGNEGGLQLHLGLHAGDVLRESDPDGRSNVYGGAVNIASRISGLSTPGEVLMSETVRSLARTSASVRFEDRGEQALKGVGEPVRVWAVIEG